MYELKYVDKLKDWGVMRKYDIKGIPEISFFVRIFAEWGDSEGISCQGNELCSQIKGRSYFYKEGERIAELKEGGVYWIGIDGGIVVEKGGILDILRLTYGYKQPIQIPVAEVEKKRIPVSLPTFSSC